MSAEALVGLSSDGGLVEEADMSAWFGMGERDDADAPKDDDG